MHPIFHCRRRTNLRYPSTKRSGRGCRNASRDQSGRDSAGVFTAGPQEYEVLQWENFRDATWGGELWRECIFIALSIFASSEKSVGNRDAPMAVGSSVRRITRTRCGKARLHLFAVRSQLPFRTSLPSPVNATSSAASRRGRVWLVPTLGSGSHCQSKTESGNLGESR